MSLNPFQVISLSLLAVVLLADLSRRLRPRDAWPARLLRVFVWLAAGVAIAQPDLTLRVANAVGIGRGADLVLYVFVLTFLLTGFHLYGRYVDLQRRLNEVVRHVAISEARRGGRPAA